MCNYTHPDSLLLASLVVQKSAHSTIAVEQYMSELRFPDLHKEHLRRFSQISGRRDYGKIGAPMNSGRKK
jgi:hypothetical protein